jgi:hypothetical protein
MALAESRSRASLLLYSSIEILLDALSVENVSTFGLNGVFCNIVADPADGRLVRVVGYKLGRVGLASQDEVRMARHLPHPRKPGQHQC